MLRIALALLVLSTVTVDAQPKAPDDTYAKRTVGKTFDEGKGFAGVLVLGQPLPEIYKSLGPGREVAGFPFWYFYDKGAWSLVVVAQMDNTAGAFVVRAIQLSGDKAPATTKGVKIGDPAKRVTDVYGKAQPFSSSVGNPLFANMVQIDVKTGAKRPLPDAEAAYKTSLFYPQLATLFVIEGGKVAKVVAVLEDDPLPDFLRDPAKVKPTSASVAVIDPKVTEPGWGNDPNNTVLHVPPPPALKGWVGPGIALDAPKGWTDAGKTWPDGSATQRWTDASGTEYVEITQSRAKPGDKPEAYFAAQEAKFGANRLIAKQRVPTAELLSMIGADAGYALSKQEGGKGKSGQPLRSFVLMAAKGDRRLVIVVTRTASGAMPSPDGETFARGVLRSVRIK